jgi:hypothetical protein
MGAWLIPFEIGYVLHMTFALNIFKYFLEHDHDNVSNNYIYTLLKNFKYLEISSKGVFYHFPAERRNELIPIELIPQIDIQINKEFEELRTYINFTFSILTSLQGDTQYTIDMRQVLTSLKRVIECYTTGQFDIDSPFYQPPSISAPPECHAQHSSSDGYPTIWVPFRQSTLGLMGLGGAAVTGTVMFAKEKLTPQTKKEKHNLLLYATGAALTGAAFLAAKLTQ